MKLSIVVQPFLIPPALAISMNSICTYMYSLVYLVTRLSWITGWINRLLYAMYS